MGGFCKHIKHNAKKKHLKLSAWEGVEFRALGLSESQLVKELLMGVGELRNIWCKMLSPCVLYFR